MVTFFVIHLTNNQFIFLVKQLLKYSVGCINPILRHSEHVHMIYIILWKPPNKGLACAATVNNNKIWKPFPTLYLYYRFLLMKKALAEDNLWYVKKVQAIRVKRTKNNCRGGLNYFSKKLGRSSKWINVEKFKNNIGTDAKSYERVRCCR